MKMKAVFAVCAVLSAFAFVGSASAAPGYSDELTISNWIEAHGFYAGGRHHAVDSAFCSGLRRYGVRSSEWGLDKYSHFKCDADNADGSFWTLQVHLVGHTIYYKASKDF